MKELKKIDDSRGLMRNIHERPDGTFVLQFFYGDPYWYNGHGISTHYKKHYYETLDNAKNGKIDDKIGENGRIS